MGFYQENSVMLLAWRVPTVTTQTTALVHVLPALLLAKVRAGKGSES